MPKEIEITNGFEDSSVENVCIYRIASLFKDEIKDDKLNGASKGIFKGF